MAIDFPRLACTSACLELWVILNTSASISIELTSSCLEHESPPSSLLWQPIYKLINLSMLFCFTHLAELSQMAVFQCQPGFLIKWANQILSALCSHTTCLCLFRSCDHLSMCFIPTELTDAWIRVSNMKGTVKCNRACYAVNVLQLPGHNWTGQVRIPAPAYSLLRFLSLFPSLFFLQLGMWTMLPASKCLFQTTFRCRHFITFVLVKQEEVDHWRRK